MKTEELTIRHAQTTQPWTVPYSPGVVQSAVALVPHILGSHDVLHAAKTVGKLAAVFEELDHSGKDLTGEQLAVIQAMSADLVTEALRLANLCHFDLATEFVKRVEEKNGVSPLNDPNIKVGEWVVGEPYLRPAEVDCGGHSRPSYYVVWAERTHSGESHGKQFTCGQGQTRKEAVEECREKMKSKQPTSTAETAQGGL